MDTKREKVRTVCALAFLMLILPTAHTEDDPDNILAFQAESAVGYNPRNVHWRSNAAGKQDVWLKRDGDSLEFAICLPRDDFVHVRYVTHSSDGWMKTAAVVIDDEEVGTFSTVDNSLYGYNWNSFNTSYGPFETRYLAQGRHVVAVVLQHSMQNDPWGIEIDEVGLAFGSQYTWDDLACPNDEKLPPPPEGR